GTGQAASVATATYAIDPATGAVVATPTGWNAATTGAERDGNGYDLGVAYESGAMSVAATYMNSTNDGTVAAGENKDTMWSLGVGYDLGAGVGLVAQYYSAKADAEADPAVSSKALIAGIEVSF
ncbi:MAG: porin, partial [Rhodospirillaceae bacterium]|nr:porin [Rhodospirillaceae bacterium]